MTRDQMKGMSIAELQGLINAHRRKLNLAPITVSSRPSSSGDGTTLEVFANDTLLAKSSNGGALNWFLKGMYAGFGNAPAPKVSNDFTNVGPRAINWR